MYLWHAFSFHIFYLPSKHQNIVKSFLSHPRAFFSCLLLYFSHDFIVWIPLRMFHLNRPSYILDSQVMISPYLSLLYFFTFFKEADFTFSNSFSSQHNWEKSTREFPYSPCPLTHPSPPSTSHIRGVCNNQWSMLTHYYHLNSIVCIMFTLAIVCSVGFDTCIMTCIYHYSILQSSF